MNKFSLGFIVGALAFSIGVGALGGWYLLRKNVSPNLVDPENSEIKANSMNRVVPAPQWAELAPILEQKNLLASPAPNNSEVIEIEESDSRLYNPVAGETLFLQANAPTEDSEGIKPRFWLRVEDFSSPELAQKRAGEYITDKTYERLATASGRGDSFIMSKSSLRLWAVARGKRVYALTTDVNLLIYIKLPKELKQSVLDLPEI